MKTYYVENMNEANEIINNDKILTDTTFIFKSGELFIDETIKITDKSNFKKYFKSEGETIFSGGVRLRYWERVDDKTYRTYAPNLTNPRHLLINGKMASRPKTPIIETNTWDTAKSSEIEFYNQTETFFSYIGDLKVFSDYKTTNKEMLNWKNKCNIECVYDVGWSHSICPIDDIVEQDGEIIIKMRKPCFRECQIKAGLQIGVPSYFENVYEYFNNPGEFYYDCDYIYYIPTDNDDMNNCDAILPVIDEILEISGNNIWFDGFDFCNTTWMKPSLYGHPELQANLAKGLGNDYEFHSNYERSPGSICIENAKDITFKNCNFYKLGCTGIDIYKSTDNISIEDCNIYDISGTGIQVGGFTRDEAHPNDLNTVSKNITIKNCEIYNIGVEYKGGVGVLIGYADGVLVSHNHIFDASYTGISVGWGWGYWDENAQDMCYSKPLAHYPNFNVPTIAKDITIEYNHIHNVMQKLHDGAGIYTIGMNRNSKIIGNLVHNNAKAKGGPIHSGIYIKRPLNDEAYAATLITQNGFPGGIYLDQASGGFEVSGNIIYDVICTIFYHDYDMKNIIDTNSFSNNYFHINPTMKDFPKEKADFAGIIKK